jgi:hypothetical protein
MVRLLALAASVAFATPAPSMQGNLGTIRPPANWVQRERTAEFPMVHVTNSFLAPAGSEVVLIGEVDGAGLPLPTVVESITDRLTSEHADIVSSGPARLCGGTEDGWSFEYVDTTSQSRIVETIVVGEFHGTAAFYVRAKNAPENAQARRALDSLCLVAAPA